MSRSQNAVHSLASFRIGRRKYYLLPFRSVAFGAVSLAYVLTAAFFVDQYVLGSLERAGWTAGELWARHNKLVEENHRRKTTTNECEPRHWTGQPLPGEGGDRRKILVLGDSFVWGPPYITLNHLWWRQLAVELERRGYQNVDVVAVGHPGWSTRRQLECARQMIPSIKPNLVIWGYVTNDPDEKLVKQIFDSQDRPPYGQRIRHQLKRLLPNLTFKFESLRADKLAEQYAGPQYGYAYPEWELKLLAGENFQRYRETVHEVGQFVLETKTAAFLQTLPHFPGGEYFEPRYARALKEWQAAGIAVNNTLDEFVGRYGSISAAGPESLRWGIDPGDSHPGPKATHFHAVMAADFIERQWPDVLGTKDASQSHKLAINDWLPYDLNVRPAGDGAFELDYPSAADMMPRLPLSEPTALVALRFPLPVEGIRIEGNGLVNCRTWISTLNPAEKYDEASWQDAGSWHEITSQGGAKALVFQLPPDLALRDLTEIRFRAVMQGNDRRLRLTLVRTASAEESR